ncbi:hypothetical protein Fcan01_11778 [Folsomia candida]|uniref:Uncharacterized protein n=1 Tax=Folsomia candida TaxID=158441 RepID=A0A226E9Y0_FOLCA|nr:hypothetical protein Fcan01_11778 [Folsomia candida]
MNGEILAILELSVASKIRDMKFCSVLKPIKTLPFVTLPASQPQALAGGYDCDGQITAGPAKHFNYGWILSLTDETILLSLSVQGTFTGGKVTVGGSTVDKLETWSLSWRRTRTKRNHVSGRKIPEKFQLADFISTSRTSRPQIEVVPHTFGATSLGQSLQPATPFLISTSPPQNKVVAPHHDIILSPRPSIPATFYLKTSILPPATFYPQPNASPQRLPSTTTLHSKPHLKHRSLRNLLHNDSVPINPSILIGTTTSFTPPPSSG